MTKLKTAVSALALAVIASPAFATPAPLTITSLTGSITVTLPDNTVKTYTGADLANGAVTIPLGAQIQVTQGDAVFTSGATAISAKSGDTFQASANGLDNASLRVDVKASNSTVQVAKGGTTSSVPVGGSLAVIAPDNASLASLISYSGDIKVTLINGVTKTISGGETADIGNDSIFVSTSKATKTTTNNGTTTTTTTTTQTVDQGLGATSETYTTTTTQTSSVAQNTATSNQVSPSAP